MTKETLSAIALRVAGEMHSSFAECETDVLTLEPNCKEFAIRLLVEVTKQAKPVGMFWHNGKGKWIQDDPDARIKGITRPLFLNPSPDDVESLKAKLTELRLTSIHQDGVIIEQAQEIERLRAALEKIGKAARLGSSLLAADIAVFASEALAAPKGG